MKVGEILRNLADAIDSASAKKSAEVKVMQAQQAGIEANSMAQQAAQDAMAQVVDLAPEPETIHVSNTDSTDCDTMVPPLQQNHGLLNPGDSINNVDTFDQSATDAPYDSDFIEIALLKKMAGIGEPEVNLNVADQLAPVEINPKKNAIQMHFVSRDK